MGVTKTVPHLTSGRLLARNTVESMIQDPMSRERLTENIVAPYLLQGSSYVVPLLSFPYLVRVLGPDRFGLLAFVQAFMQYFVMLTDHGFSLSATRARGELIQRFH